MTKQTNPNAGVTNPRLLVFPQDATGFLYKLKNETLKAIERQNGNQEKHEALMGSLRVLAQFAVARYAMQADARAAAIAELAEGAEVAPDEETPAADAPTEATAPSEPTTPANPEPTAPTEPSEPANASA